MHLQSGIPTVRILAGSDERVCALIGLEGRAHSTDGAPEPGDSKLRRLAEEYLALCKGFFNG